MKNSDFAPKVTIERQVQRRQDLLLNSTSSQTRILSTMQSLRLRPQDIFEMNIGALLSEENDTPLYVGPDQWAEAVAIYHGRAYT